VPPFYRRLLELVVFHQARTTVGPLAAIAGVSAHIAARRRLLGPLPATVRQTQSGGAKLSELEKSEGDGSISKKIKWINGLAIFGLFVSAIGSVLNSVLGGGSPWTSAVLSAALLAMAIAFISFLKATQEFHAMVEAQIKAQTPDRDSLALLRHLLRSVIFRDQSGFDPVFWTAFGQCVLSQDHLGE